MKVRFFFSILAAVVLSLLVISGSGLIWLVSRSPLEVLQGGPQAVPEAAMFVPKQAPFMASLLVNSDRLLSVQQVLTAPGDRRQAAAELQDLRQSLVANLGLDYAADIQPWLGEELTFAVTTPDLDREAINGQQPGYLLAASTQDPAQVRDFLQIFWQRQAVAGADLIFEQYAGVKLIYKEAQPDLQPQPGAASGMNGASGPNWGNTGIATALVGDRFLLLANHPKVLREAITNVQAADLSLKGSPAYQEALQSLPERRIGVTFVNLPQLSTWLGTATGTGESGAIAAQTDAVSPLFDSLVAALKLDRQGISAETALITAAGQVLRPSRPHLSEPVDALRYIPSNSGLVAAGIHLDQTWQDITAGLAGYDSLLAVVNQPVATVGDRWDLDLPQDIFRWVQGEYALGLLPQPDSTHLDWVFVAQRSGPDTNEEIQQLDTLATRRGLSVGQLTLANQPVSAWTRLSTLASNRSRTLQADVVGAHAQVGQYEVFASSLDALELALASDRSLQESAAFQQAVAALGDRNDGYLYLNWPKLQQWAEQQIPLVRFVELTAQPIFRRLQSVTISSYGSDRQLRQGGVFVSLTDS